MKLDQFYTKPEVALEYYYTLLNHFKKLGLDFKTTYFVEPSAGSGSFLEVIKSKNKIGLDIDPKHKDVLKQDFLVWSGPERSREHVVVIGNPPFGRRAKLAIDFFNKSAEFASTIGFILPVQFRKYSTHSKLDERFKLVIDKPLLKNSFLTEDGKDFDVNCIFQVWTELKTKLPNKRILKSPPIKHPDFEIYQYNNTPEALKVFSYDFDFAVPRQGYEDYKRKEFDPSRLERHKQWVLFKARSEEAKNRLLEIDFEKLSRKNTVVPGFGKADVVEEYNKKYGNIIYA